jgi:hypothetical protein
MNKRPTSVTIISVIFIAVGCISFVAGLRQPVDATAVQGIQHSSEWVAHVVRILAILGGAFMLFGFNWARWLLVFWMGFHIVAGFLHAPWKGFVHILLFSIIAYFLFRPRASAYFRGTRAEPTQIQKTDDSPLA